jgi:hypothetical protein
MPECATKWLQKTGVIIMPESHTLFLWLSLVLDWPQTLAHLLGPVPGWVLLSLIFVPSLIALVARIWHFIFPVLMLNALVALTAMSWPAGELRTFSIGLGSAFILGFIGQGLRQRARDHALAQIQTRLDAMDEQTTAFLRALDKRAAIVEESAIELAKIRLRNEASGATKGEPQSRLPNP